MPFRASIAACKAGGRKEGLHAESPFNFQSQRGENTIIVPDQKLVPVLKRCKIAQIFTAPFSEEL